jgi:soluble lytic murein transglycosylase-like protein
MFRATATIFVLFAAILLYSHVVMAGNILVLDSGKRMKVDHYEVDGEILRASINDKSEMAIPLSWVREIRTLPDPVIEKPAVEQADLDETAGDFAFSDLVLSVARKHGVDWKLVAAVMKTESNFNPRARSPKGAQGLMQLMPQTAKLYSVTDAYDPAQNVEAGVRHLKMLLQRYPGNLNLVLAAYNSGEKTVDRYRGIPPYAETRSYVKKVLQWMQGLSS